MIERQAEKDKYLFLASKRPKYFSRNHGDEALSYVAGFRPKFCVDFGCGDNAFIESLRQLGFQGKGIDFVCSRADLLVPMHSTGLPEGVADLITSFDAMEHLIPADVDPVLAEMRRVSKPSSRFVFSIGAYPLQFLEMELHPSGNSPYWWSQKIREVAVNVETFGPNDKYTTGIWRC